jgi:hypothetical protein
VEMPYAQHTTRHACNKLSLDAGASDREEFSNTLISMRLGQCCVCVMAFEQRDVLIRPNAAIIHSVVHHLFQRRQRGSKVVDEINK